jgi:hypothetical protein
VNLSKNVKITRLAAYQGAAGSDYTSAAAVNMADYEGCLFIASIGTAAANNGMKILQSSDNGSVDTFADLEGSKVLSDATQTQFAIDIYRPQEQYLRPTIIRGTSTTIESVWAIQYGPKKAPVTNTSTTLAAETHVSPDEGTA